MKARLAFAITVFAIQALGAPDLTSEQRERTVSAFVLGLGRAPSSHEIDARAGTASISDLITALRGEMRRDRELAIRVAHKAWRDALGSEPDARVIAESADEASTYAALVAQHLQRLAAHPDEYRAVIDRAYRRAVQRAAYDIEYDYWSRRDVLPFMLLVGCIENWAVRNAPGLMSTTGTPSISINSAHLTTARLSPAVAREAREAIGLESAIERAQAAAIGCAVVAPGAARIVSVGGIHFVATGLPATGPGN